MTSLLPDVLESVFSLLSKPDLVGAAQVCHVWRDVAYRPRLWVGETPYVRKHGLPTKWSQWPDVLKRCLNSYRARRLDGLNVLGLSDEDLVTCVQSLRDLTRLSIVSVEILESARLSWFLECLPQLEELRVAQLSLVNESGKGGLECIVTSLCSSTHVCRLQVLAIRECKLTATCMVKIAESPMVNLTSLDVSYTALCDEDFVELVEMPSPDFSLSLISYEMSRTRPQGNTVAWITSHFHNLKRLNLSACTTITDECIHRICNKLPNITSLDISCNHSIHDHSLVAIATFLLHIEELYLAGCINVTDNELCALKSVTKSLEILDISWCRQIRSLTGLVVGSSSVSLRKLYLKRCLLIAVDVMSCLTHMPRLQLLDVEETAASAPYVIQYCKSVLPDCKVLTTAGTRGDAALEC